jgi:Trypsin
MRRSFLALVAAAALAVMAAAPAAAITGNYRPDDEHGFVGLIAFYDANWTFIHRCTGELLSPTVVLTAGHCVNDPSQPDGAVAAHARIWVLQDVGSHYDVNTQHDNVTGYPDSCTGTLGDGKADGWCGESSTLFNYGFDNFAGFPNIHDVGIVVLDNALPQSEYATLAGPNTVDFLETARGTQDTDLRASGYGISFSLTTPAKGPNAGGSHNLALSFRVRLEADLHFNGTNGQFADGFSIKAEGNGNGNGGTCNGDSGGPIFWPADSNQVVAVTSWGIANAGCRGVGYYYRTDRSAVLDWIHSVVGDSLWSEITVS